VRGVIPLVLLLLTHSSFACSSDCYQCHSDIPSDKEHVVLKTCTDCHPEHSEEAFNSKCGADCFDCHSAKKVMESSRAHAVIRRCIDCHKNLKASEYNEIYRELLK